VQSPNDLGEDLEYARPNPACVVESLRAVGYSTQRAVCDLIDNSIAAGAANVRVTFHWDGDKSVVVIADDGCGMTERKLVEAMTLGSISPTQLREPTDLGRFGFGLKTASFSQARVLSVGSKTANSSIAWREWDLDFVSNDKQDWVLKKKVRESTEQWAAVLHDSPGTVCVWQQVDAIVEQGMQSTDAVSQKRFLRLVNIIEQHLGLTYHRYLRKKRLRIWLNDVPVKPADPFLEAHPFTQSFASESLERDILVHPFILPHPSKLSEQERNDTSVYSSTRQGFYVYRNDRLLVEGGWLGLGMRSSELFNLARIAVDLPNRTDLEWAIDIKKSRVRIPGKHIDRLRRLARITRERARQTSASRGKVAVRTSSPNFHFVWHTITDGEAKIRINRQHPIVKAFIEELKEKGFDGGTLLSLLETTVPLAQIQSLGAVDDCQEPDDVATLIAGLRGLIQAGKINLEWAAEVAESTEPLHTISNLVLLLSAETEVEDK
jgi:hypothetical protein